MSAYGRVSYWPELHCANSEHGSLTTGLFPHPRRGRCDRTLEGRRPAHEGALIRRLPLSYYCPRAGGSMRPGSPHPAPTAADATLRMAAQIWLVNDGRLVPEEVCVSFTRQVTALLFVAGFLIPLIAQSDITGAQEATPIAQSAEVPPVHLR